jgi:hypothetical protein
MLNETSIFQFRINWMRFWLKMEEQFINKEVKKLFLQYLLFKMKSLKLKHISMNHYILPIVQYNLVENQKINNCN